MMYDSHNPSLKMALKAIRDQAIEECARVARSICEHDSAGATPWEMAQEIAAAIRALKDKPDG